MADGRTQYWDSCVFLSYITEYPGRVEVIDELIRDLEKGSISVVTSSLTIAEIRLLPVPRTKGPVAGQEDKVKTQPVDPEKLKKVRELFASDLLDIRVLTERIAAKAAETGDRFPKLVAGDCIHIATALVARADVLCTYDGDRPGERRRPTEMIRYDNKIDGLRIRPPRPWMPGMFAVDV